MTKGFDREDRESKKARVFQRNAIVECHYCGVSLDGKSVTFDHIKARSKGGSNTPKNLVPSCSECNMKKGELDYEVFKEAMLPVKQARRSGLPVPEVALPKPKPPTNHKKVYAVCEQFAISARTGKKTSTLAKESGFSLDLVEDMIAAGNTRMPSLRKDIAERKKLFERYEQELSHVKVSRGKPCE